MAAFEKVAAKKAEKVAAVTVATKPTGTQTIAEIAEEAVLEGDGRGETATSKG